MLTEASRHPGRKRMRHRGIEASSSILAPHPSRLLRPGFTLTELMVAVAVLLVVIIGTSKIFSTTSKVTGIGQATAGVMQEAAAIERQIRADLADLNYDGVFAIRCVKVRNDINLPGGGLLNPNLPETDFVRADQLLFFTHGVESLQSFRLEGGINHKGQGTAARVYWGHTFQLPRAEPYEVESPDRGRAHDPLYDPNDPILPWHMGQVDMQRTLFKTIGNTGGENDIFKWNTAAAIDGTQPPATEWLLGRQDVALVDDDNADPDRNSKTAYLYHNQTARSIFLFDTRVSGGFVSYEILNGRMDAAASQMEDVRDVIRYPGQWNPYQRDVIRNQLLYYPRAERIAPSMHRVDQALTNHVIGSACSSFTVEWTYENRVGEVYVDGLPYLHGVEIDSDREQPWFGMYDEQRGVCPYDSSAPWVWWNRAESIAEANLEQYDNPGTVPVEIYEAFFGYNQSNPLDEDGNADADLGYTPWPNAIRITMTLHDPETKLENGKVFQFVINLPGRVEETSTY